MERVLRFGLENKTVGSGGRTYGRNEASVTHLTLFCFSLQTAYKEGSETARGLL